MQLEYEAMECIYRFRRSKQLEGEDYSDNFSFYSAHTLGKNEETRQSGEAYIKKIAEVRKRVTDSCFPCKDPKKFFSRKTWITNRIKRHKKTRDILFQFFLKPKSERAHLKYENIRNEVNMEIKLAKRRDVQKKLIKIIPWSFSVLLGKWKE